MTLFARLGLILRLTLVQNDSTPIPMSSRHATRLAINEFRNRINRHSIYAFIRKAFAVCQARIPVMSVVTQVCG